MPGGLVMEPIILFAGMVIVAVTAIAIAVVAIVYGRDVDMKVEGSKKGGVRGRVSVRENASEVARTSEGGTPSPGSVPRSTEP